jgi:carbon storage regulator
MLYLTRKPGEAIVINDDIELTVVEVRGRTIKLGFTFPPTASVLRRELHDRIKSQGVTRDEESEANEEESSATDERKRAAAPDRDRIHVDEEYELRDWSQKFGVTPERLKEAVAKAGPIAADVAKHLGK